MSCFLAFVHAFLRSKQREGVMENGDFLKEKDQITKLPKDATFFFHFLRFCNRTYNSSKIVINCLFVIGAKSSSTKINLTKAMY